MTWLMGWTYRKSHTITGSAAGIQTDYQVGIKVYYGSGVDGTEVVDGTTFGKVYVDSLCRTDFGDIRFAKLDATLLDYWIEEQVDSDYAIIWVKVDSIPANPNTVDIYMYYGKADATTISNGAATFITWNDCDDASDWDVDLTAGTPIWGERTVDGFSTIMLETNGHGEKIKLKYNGGASGGRENRRFLTRIKHTNWNTDSYMIAYAMWGVLGSDYIYYSSFLDEIRLYALYDGASDHGDKAWAHPSGWIRYQTIVNVNGELDGYSDNTALTQAITDGDYADGVQGYYAGQFGVGACQYYVDWFSVGKYVDPEPTHTSWGPATLAGTGDLACSFNVGQGSTELLGTFTVPQGANDLLGEFFAGKEASLELPAQFIVLNLGSEDLPASFRTGGRGNVPARLRVTKYYDLDGTGGIAFYWWGAANPPEAMNQLILESPTGFWYTDFYDGPVAWRLVEIPWGNFTWVSAPQRRLEPHRYWPYPPDKTMIDAFIWTVHTHGLRRLDYVYAYPRGPASLYGKINVRRTATPVEFAASFVVSHTNTSDVKAGFDIILEAVNNLKAGFTVRQGIADLSASFEVVGLQLDVYEVDASAQDDASSSWTDMVDMEQDVSVENGDQLIITFEGNFYVAPSDKADFRIEVDGTPITYNAEVSNDGSSGSSARLHQRVLVGVYIHSGGSATITIKVTWDTPSGDTVYVTDRKLITQHFY